MKKSLILSLLIASLLMLAGCANSAAHKDPDTGADDRLHGSVGVRFQSQDTARFGADRAPY